MSVINKRRGIIIALDMPDVTRAIEIVTQFNQIQGNFVIKIGRPLEMQKGYKIISEIKKRSKFPIIYDGKIADIPYISKSIAKIAYEAGADAIIVHGFVGKDVIEAILELSMGDVIVVVSMTHTGASQFLNPLSKKIAELVNSTSAHGVVLPATYPRILSSIRSILKENIYIISPGIKTQGAQVGDAIKFGADYEIIGRAIYNSPNPKKQAEEFYKKIIEI